METSEEEAITEEFVRVREENREVIKKHTQPTQAVRPQLKQDDRVNADTLGGLTAKEIIDKARLFSGGGGLKRDISNGDGTHPHADNTDEQTIVEFTPSVVTELINIYFDVDALTQDATLKVYSKIDGTNYKELTDLRLLLNSTRRGGGVVMKQVAFSTDFKFTLTSSIGEGASRDVPYRYLKEEY